MVRFRVFSPEHWLILSGIAIATAGVILGAPRLRERGRLEAAERAVAIVALVLWVVNEVRAFLPGRFDPAESWPLHICVWAALAAPLALVVRRRILYALVYFWGIALSLQALLTPVFAPNTSALDFWLFWFRHGVILAVALYLVTVRGWQPEWRDWGIAAAAGIGYLAIVLPIDVAFGVNYGYVGNAAPAEPTLIDFLGPWPARVLVMMALGAVLMALLMLPFLRARRAERAP